VDTERRRTPEGVLRLSDNTYRKEVRRRAAPVSPKAKLLSVPERSPAARSAGFAEGETTERTGKKSGGAQRRFRRRRNY